MCYCSKDPVIFFKFKLNFILQCCLIYHYSSVKYLYLQTRALSQNVTNAPEGALTPNLKNVEVTVQNKLHYWRKFSGHNSSMENQQIAITPKVCIELWFLCTALLHNDICLWNFKSVAWILFELCTRQNSRMKMNKKGNNSNSMKLWVMVLVHCTSPQWHLST